MTSWLKERRDEARAVYERTPLPTLRDEHWRYTSLRGIDFDAFRDAAPETATEAPTLLGGLETAGELHQVGDTITALRAPEGIVLASLEEAVLNLEEHDDVRAVFAALAPAGVAA